MSVEFSWWAPVRPRTPSPSRCTTFSGHALRGVSWRCATQRPRHCLDLRCSAQTTRFRPSEASDAAERILACVADAGAEDLVITCFTGGSSALSSLPPEKVEAADKRVLHQQLLSSGLAITDVNVVRKQVSAFKGGRVALARLPARVVNLTVSDVAGSPLDAITDPTVQDTSASAQARAILQQAELWNLVPSSVRAHLERDLPTPELAVRTADGHAGRRREYSSGDGSRGARRWGTTRCSPITRSRATPTTLVSSWRDGRSTRLPTALSRSCTWVAAASLWSLSSRPQSSARVGPTSMPRCGPRRSWPGSRLPHCSSTPTALMAARHMQAPSSTAKRLALLASAVSTCLKRDPDSGPPRCAKNWGLRSAPGTPERTSTISSSFSLPRR